MKKITLLFSVFSSVIVFAQLPVSQVAGKKKVLLEEFTGIHCGYCPDGHRISDQLTTGNPTNVFSVNIHPTCNYTTPNAGELDFRVPDGISIGAMPQMGGGYPKGAVNRAPATNPFVGGGFTMSRGGWDWTVNNELTKDAYINLAGEATLNTATRVLTINMEAYYTANASALVTNNITIMLKQDNIMCPQSGSGYYPAMVVGGSYKHMHALRDVITSGGAFGEALGGNATAGTLYQKTFTYTVSASYTGIPAVLSDLDITAFISEDGGKNIINVAKVPITTSATGVNEVKELVNNVNVFPNPALSVANVNFNIVESNNVSVTLSNLVGQIVFTANLGHLKAGAHTYPLDASKINSGLYLISVRAGGTTITKSISINN